ncbi:unnamed protein product [Lupinus luteus]|uniref:Transcription repressor n=1 Tax=Lupinus luteus TaxID=3873 RepID=A0AAV1XLH8_LUPLU
MPKKIPKFLRGYLSKIKAHHPAQIQLSLNSFSSSKNWILSGRKNPKTPSFHFDDTNETHGCSNNNINHKDDTAATLADVDRFLLENFKSLYLKDDDDVDGGENEEGNGNKYKNTKRVLLEKQNHDDEEPKLGPIFYDSPRLVEIPRDLCGSTRFFVKPGFSRSLLDDAITPRKMFDREESGSNRSTKTQYDKAIVELPDNCITLLKYSVSPYEEFRRSMKEMMEARGRSHESDELDWEFMEELLFCYLDLNDKKSHKFILGAFVDLITAMRDNSETTKFSNSID